MKQPDFLAQKSSVQEAIEDDGHLCIFLPKFHCKLNLIEFFWGAVKRYLHNHCDYTFEGLEANPPKALVSVQLSTIWKWEYRMMRWMHANRDGKYAIDAQFDVERHGSKQYTSHHQTSEMVAHQFDKPSLTN